MLQIEKFNRTLILSILFSFFVYTSTTLLILFQTAFKGLWIQSFLSTFSTMTGTILIFILQVIKYLSLSFMVGAIIALIVIFIMDIVVNTAKSN